MKMAVPWSFHNLKNTSTLLPPFEPYQPFCASISTPIIGYGDSHLLGIAFEIRQYIWNETHKDIVLNPIYDWRNEPKTAYDALMLTCRQIYHEVSDRWPLNMVSKQRIDAFVDQPLSTFQFHMLRRLSFEIPFNLSPLLIEDLASVLRHEMLTPILEHLQLFFVGLDRYGTETYVHGCGLIDADSFSTSTRLPIDGQGHELRQNIFLALLHLKKLKSLVLGNCQYPLLQTMIIHNKPWLEKLHICTDPRSVLHQSHRILNTSIIYPPLHNFPPIKELEISANSALTALQTASKVASTLEKLSWVVPDPSRQSTNYSSTWWQSTNLLLQNLSGNAHHLHTLRICHEGTLYEGGYQYGEFIGGCKEYIPRIKALKNLELHLLSKSPWLGSEIIEALPNTIERVYVSDRSITPQQLLTVVFGDAFDRRLVENTPYQRTHSKAWKHHLDPHVDTTLTWETIQASLDAKATRSGCVHSSEAIIGENLDRSDFIFLGHGLAFITFEYLDSKWDSAMLFMNGRILDGTRHRYIHDHPDCGKRTEWYIPPRLDRRLGWVEYLPFPAQIDNRFHGYQSPRQLRQNSNSRHKLPRPYAADPVQPYDTFYLSPELGIAPREEHDAKCAQFDRDSHDYRPDNHYFGNEHEAVHVFCLEAVVPPEDLAPPPHYPAIIEDDEERVGAKHWMSDETWEELKG